MDGREIIDTMLALNKRYGNPAVMVTIERGQIEKALGPFLNTEMLETGNYMTLNPVVPTKDKQQRARSWQARMRSGTVLFDTKADWYLSYEQEHLRFPRDKHDDQVDASAYLGLSLDKFANAPSSEDLFEEEYEQEYRSTMRPMGRSTIGGY
jgi:predicted phage terminase large subunit-like protein